MEGPYESVFVGVFALFFAASMFCIPAVYPQQGTPAFSDVNQIFQTQCVKCHSGTRPPQGLRLDSYKDAMAGSKDMQIIVKGEPGKKRTREEDQRNFKAPHA